MTYFMLIFIPPAYFLSRKKWGGFVVNAVLYGIACLCAATLVFAMAGAIFWFLAFGHATFAYRREMAARNAELIATKMAEKMVAAQKGPNA